MKNIIKSGFKTLATITLCAAALPACDIIGGAWPEAEPFSGVNVYNCTKASDPSWPPPLPTTRAWDVWVAKGQGLEITQWFPAEPRNIVGLPFDAQGEECTNNDKRPHAATFNFADLGVADKEKVTVRIIKNGAGGNDPWKPNCQEFEPNLIDCKKWCNPDDPATCGTVVNPGNAYPDAVDTVYVYSKSAPYATQWLNSI